jgi:hypothetical protein
MITATPSGRRLSWLFTIMQDAIVTEDFVFWLTELHHHFGRKIIVIWDSLSAHLSTQRYFSLQQCKWLVFEYFPTYSPELNPVEQCWQWMKNEYMCNFVAKNRDELVAMTLQASTALSADPRLLPNFFHHAKIHF